MSADSTKAAKPAGAVPGDLAEHATSKSWIPSLMLVCAAAAFVLWRAWVCDDAYITFRHVRNCLDGYGAVFNVGERVQGFTHPLWFLLLLGGGALADLHAFAVSAGLVLTTLTILLMSWFLRGTDSLAMANATSGDPPGPDPASTTLLLGVSILLASRTFVQYQTSGLETSLSHLLIVSLWGVALFRREVHCSPPIGMLTLLCSLLVLNRADHLMTCGPMLVWIIVHLLRSRGRGSLRVAAGLAPALIWYGFATIYYGTPLPNTAYAKVAFPLRVSVAHGLSYVCDYAAHEPVHAAVIAVAMIGGVIVSFGHLRTRHPQSAMLACLTLGLWIEAGFVIAIGGDFMRGRFLLPILVGSVLLGSYVLMHCVPVLRAQHVLLVVLAMLPSISCLVQIGLVDLPAALRSGLRAAQDQLFYAPVRSSLALAALFAVVRWARVSVQQTAPNSWAPLSFLLFALLQLGILIVAIGHWSPDWYTVFALAAAMLSSAAVLGLLAAGCRLRAAHLAVALCLLWSGASSLGDIGPQVSLIDERTGIADEYSFYHGDLDESRFHPPDAFRNARRGDWAYDRALAGRYSDRFGPIALVWETLGYSSHQVGPNVHIIDALGLTDAFIARSTPDPHSRVGHIRHQVPPGYLEAMGAINLLPDWKRRIAEMDPTLRQDAEQMKRAATWTDPAELRRFEQTRLVISGPIISRDRLRALPSYIFPHRPEAMSASHHLLLDPLSEPRP